MRSSEQNEATATASGALHAQEIGEQQLREEIEELRKQLEEAKRAHKSDPHPAVAPVHLWRPSRITIAALLLATAIVLLIAFLAGYGPLRSRTLTIMAESRAQAQALPRVTVARVVRSTADSDLSLPGSIQAITEAPVLARAEGYIQRRLADIGDRVHAGQTLAEIDVPEIDDQVQQAGAALDQARAAEDEAAANLDQGRSDLELAKLSSERWNALVGRGAVSKQENDQYQTQYRSRVAGVRSLEKAVTAQQQAVAAAVANLARLTKLRDYRVVTAPFDGVITLRNVDTGALVNAGSTLLFRIAQTGRLRIYVNVPQSYAQAVRPGQKAVVSVSSMAGRRFTGAVARTANSLDPATRTLLTEVQLENRDGILEPGMYADVDLSTRRSTPPFVIPANALIVRTDGSQVALLGPGGSVHLRRIRIDRDYGDRLEVSDGLRDGDEVVLNPGDSISEGSRVEPVRAAAP